ncbi:hypothetical protein GCM10023237_09340 [Streptomyces coeruleoprunus]
MDVIISNGVINLSPRKARVMVECARVLLPGGRFCVSDLTVRRDDLPPETLDDCVLYPRFDADTIALMRRLLLPEWQDDVAVAVVVRPQGPLSRPARAAVSVVSQVYVDRRAFGHGATVVADAGVGLAVDGLRP